MKIRIIVLWLLTLAWTAGTHAGDLNVGGNLGVASNLTAQAVVVKNLAATTLAVTSVTLGGETRSNWPSGPTAVGVVDLPTAVLDFMQPGQLYRYTLTGDTTWVFTNHVAGRQVWLQVAQDSTGGWENTWPANLLWPADGAHNGSTSQNCWSVFKVLDNGSAWLAQAEGLSYRLPCGTNCQCALQFDGRQNSVSLGSLFGTVPPAITIEMWVKGAAPTKAGNYLFSMVDLANSLSIDGAGQLVGGVATDAGTHLQTVPGNIMDGNWHHVALVWDGARQRLYVDGVKKATTSIGGSLKISPAYLGAPTGAGPVTGTMDEVRLSKIARYTDTFSPACGWTTDANTVALWHLNEGRGTTVTDSSGHGHNGTLHGAPTPTWVDGVTCGKP